MKKPRAQFECAILVDGRTAWKGKRPVRVYRRIRARHPRAKISILLDTPSLYWIFSRRFSEWIEIQNLLADTGADLTLLPLHLGELLLPDIRDAKSGIVRGIVPGRGLRIYVHQLSLRIGSRSFRGAVGIADSTAVPALLGRHQALDRFTAVYRRGKILVLES